MIWTDSFGEGTTLNKQKRADLLLVMVTFFWGASYYLTNLCLTDLQPMNLNAFRFLSAFAVLGVVFRKRLRRISRATLCYTLLVGLALTGTYVAYGYGVSRTSVSNAAFICALPVVVTPIFDFFFCHKKPGRRLLFSLAICTAGLALMTLNDGLRPASGDLICLIVPVCYAVDLLLTERAVRDPAVDPLTLGVCQLGVVGVLTLGMSLLIERPHLPTTAATWAAALFLGLLCSGVAFVVQTVQQQYTTASHVGLIFTLEPVFASIVAFVLGGERLPARGYVGAALMLLSLVMMEVDLDGLLHKKTPPAAAFDGKGALYAAARPDYPQALAQMLQERLHLTAESTVADIGAGTGKWTARLLSLGCRVCAVEPNGSMRREAERLLGGEPRLTLLGGSAEHTGLPDASVDCVTAAQAFHWFDRERFRAECRRILTPEGRVALIYNERRTDTPVMQALDVLYRESCPGYQGFSRGFRREEAAAFFPGGAEEISVPNDMTYDRAGFVRRCLSASYAPAEGEPGYEALSGALGTLFDHFAEGGRLTLAARATLWLGRP